MAEQNRESSMEEILSSIKRIIAEDKVIDTVEPAAVRKKIAKPALKAVPDPTPQDDDVLELTNEVSSDEIPAREASEQEATDARGVFGDRRKEDRLIDDNKLDAMRQSLSALVSLDRGETSETTTPQQGTSLEDMTREMMRPMLKAWLDNNLPTLVEELVAKEIARINGK